MADRTRSGIGRRVIRLGWDWGDGRDMMNIDLGHLVGVGIDMSLRAVVTTLI